MHEFDAELEGDAGPGAGVRLPFDAEEVYGSRGRTPVKGTINGVPFRTSVMSMGETFWLGFRREYRDAAGVQVGDRVRIRVERDDEPRDVSVPGDLAGAMAADPNVGARFVELSYTHRKEWVRWVEGAKRAETRQRRIEKAVKMLAAGVRHP